MFSLVPTEDEWAEAEMLADEMAPAPFKQSPEKGIAAMEHRIAALNRRIADCQDDSQVPVLTAQLRDAEQRLNEYRAQLNGRN